MVDDQASWTLGCQGHANAHTPQLDELASQGARLEQLFTTAAVCSPSRASMLAGCYPTQTGLSPDGDVKHLDRSNIHGLLPGIPTWPGLLRESGYRTALLGKWHVCHANSGPLPPAHGFDFFTGWPMQGGSSRDREIILPEPNFPNLDIPRVARMTREYHASVHSVDRNVGRILAHLDKLNLASSTIVIFTSDHGLNLGHHGLWHKGNGGWLTHDRLDPSGVLPGRSRLNLFDTSVQVPGIVRWPDHNQPGTRINHNLSFVDWLPTLLQMAGFSQAMDQWMKSINDPLAAHLSSSTN